MSACAVLTISVLLLFATLCRSHAHNSSDDSASSPSPDVPDESQAPPSPCRYDHDVQYGGRLVDCRGRSIASLPLPESWIPAGSTSLWLDSNHISILDNHSFPLSTSRSIRHLSLSYNAIRTVDALAFKELVNLVVLDLEHNQINMDRQSLSAQTFAWLPGLQRLSLAYNGNKEKIGRYTSGLLASLHELQNLSLDTFLGNLEICPLFHKGSNFSLSELYLTGGMKRITNQSFSCFNSFPLKTLNIYNALYLANADQGAFQFFPELLSLTLYTVALGSMKTLQSLEPFAGRNMTSLVLCHISSNYKLEKVFNRDCVITRQMFEYASKICVENFVLRHSMTFMVETGTITNPLWRRCLKTLDVSENPLSGEGNERLRLRFLHNLRSLRMTKRKYSIFGKRHRSHAQTKSSTLPMSVAFGLPAYEDHTIGPRLPNVRYNFSEVILANISDYDEPGQTTRRPVGFDANENDGSVDSADGGIATYYLPKNIELIDLESASTHMMHMDMEVRIIGGSKLKQINLADNGIEYFTGTVYGAGALQVFDISRNEGSKMSKEFFDCYPAILDLNMADMNLDSGFMAAQSHRLFANLTSLVSLDLSDNGLRILSQNTFSTNSRLSSLTLRRNRLEGIPFDIYHMPRLSYLDLRTNSILWLSKEQIISLESHARNVDNFTLRLEGNIFSCGCSNIRFLSWLQRTQVKLDRDRNYSCVLNTGMLGAVAHNMDGLEALWRMCVGQVALLGSILLACLLILTFLLFVLVSKFQTQLRAFFLRVLWRGSFVIKTPSDYPVGVYLGYADHDINLACMTLRRYMEDRLQLTTYVRHRDLLPASDMAQSILEAINSSWRVVLLISDHFLEDPWSYFTLKVATYAVQANNPRRLVLILKESQSLLHKVPRFALETVTEDNIIFMAPDGQISYEQEKALKTALLYHEASLD